MLFATPSITANTRDVTVPTNDVTSETDGMPRRRQSSKETLGCKHRSRDGSTLPDSDGLSL